MDESRSVEQIARWLDKPYVAKGVVGITEVAIGRACELFARRDADTLSKQVARYIATRSTTCFSALRLLSQEGYIAESIILLRLLLQNLVNLAYINGEPEARARLYDQQLDVAGHRFAEEASKLLADAPGGFSLVVNSGDQDTIPDRELPRKGEEWGNLKVKKMAEESGMAWAYTLYGLCSHIAHGNAVSGYESGVDPLKGQSGGFEAVVLGGGFLCATLREAVKTYGLTPGEIIGTPYQLLGLLGVNVSEMDGLVRKLLGQK